MKQILHIFKKDVRQFWLEILLSLALVAAFAMRYPRLWPSANYGFGAVGYSFTVDGGTEVLASLLVILVPVAWWILITRVVHGENLVGDRQFWVTRPYEWKKLLAAKALFLLTFLYLPIFVAQCVLLKTAGFQPHSHIPGLLFNLLLTTFFLVLPFFALATVTASFAKTTLTVLAILLGFVGIEILSSILYTFHVTSSNTGVDISSSLLAVICAVVPVVQYATRRVWLSRLLLLVLPVSMFVMSFVSPDAVIIYKNYPRGTGSQASPLQFALDTDLGDQGTARWDRSSKIVSLNIPLKVSGIREGTAVQLDNVMLSIDAPNGLRWTSPWQSAYGRRSLPETPASEVEVNVSRAFYDEVRASPVTLHLTFAITELRVGSSSNIQLPLGRFPVPHVGICSPDVTWETLYITGISCLSALHQPALNYVSVLWSSTRCSEAPTPQATGVQGAGWVGALDNSPADFGITSVWRTSVNLSNNGTENRFYTPENRHLCPGTTVTFTPYDSVRRTQTDLTIPNFRLPSYLPEKVNP